MAASPLLAVHGALLVVHDLAAHLAAALMLLALAFVALAFAVHRLAVLRSPGAAVGILLVAVLLRALLLPLPPTLSDDLLRYVWDGRVAAEGLNPYRLAPQAPELTALRDESWHLVPHREVPTVYPPLALGWFSIASHLPRPLVAVKLLPAAADTVTCGLLLLLAARCGLPPARILWYAWNPLVTLEVAGMGHVDALGVAAAVAAVVALTSRPPKTLASAAAAAAGVLAKLGPLAALAMWSRQSGRPARWLGAAGLVVAAAVLPVVVSTAGVPPGLITYGVSWEFNGPLYEPLWRLLDGVDAAGLAAGALDSLKQVTRQWERWNWIFPYLYPQLLAKLLLGCGALVVVARSLAESRPVEGTGRLFGTLLLLSATFYPWYLLWVLPWAALALHPAWLALSALILASYLPQFTALDLFPWIFLLIWVPFWVLLVRHRRWSTD